MNTRAFTLALIISGVAMFMIYTYIEDQKNVIVKQYGQPMSVVVAKVDINELELIDDSKVTVTTVPRSLLSPGYFKEVKEVENTVASVPILKGEQITKPRVTFPGAQTGLSRQVSAGKRAMSLAVNEQSGVGKLIKPGDRVDVIAVLDIGNGRQDLMKTKTVLQDVLVLSTGQNITNSLPMIGVEVPKVVKTMNLNTYVPYNTVTLELDPYQVQKLMLTLTIAKNKPFLSLRNNADKEVVRIKSTRFFDVLDEDAEEAKAYFAEKFKKGR